MSDKLIQILGLSLGWGFIALGVLLIVRALFADRSRGRRRCPRCWYSMEGVPSLQCPECGRTAKREQRLFRTRRRHRRAIAASLLPLLGVGALYTSGVLRHGWTRTIPTTVLVATCPINTADWNHVGISPAASSLVGGSASFSISLFQFPPVAPPPMGWKELLTEELKSRIGRGSLTDWQARLLARRMVIAGRAAGSNPIVFDDPAFLDTAWLLERADEGSLAIEVPRLTYADVFNPSAYAAALLKKQARLHALVVQLFRATGVTVIGPVVVCWDREFAEGMRTLAAHAAQAATGTPSPIDADDWDGRVAMLRRLQSSTLQLDTKHTLTEVLKRTAEATDIKITAIDWAHVVPEIEREVVVTSGSAHEVLSSFLLCAESDHDIIRWTVTPDHILVNTLSRRTFESRHLRAPLMRVYDVRDILRTRLASLRYATLKTEIDTLLTEAKNAADPAGAWRIPMHIFNGRLIVNAEFEQHLAIEAHLAECAKHPTARLSHD